MLEWRGFAVESAVRRASREAVNSFMQRVFDDSQQLVPEETGSLKESGRIEAQRDEVRIVYDAPYAAVIHEGFRHDPRTSKLIKLDTRTKYLEEPFTQRLPELASLIQSYVRQALNGR